jgi:hypothetical protein
MLSMQALSLRNSRLALFQQQGQQIEARLMQLNQLAQQASLSFEQQQEWQSLIEQREQILQQMQQLQQELVVNTEVAQNNGQVQSPVQKSPPPRPVSRMESPGTPFYRFFDGMRVATPPLAVGSSNPTNMAKEVEVFHPKNVPWSDGLHEMRGDKADGARVDTSPKPMD